MKTTTKSPLISVLLPVYNGQSFLATAIKSIQNQTLTDFELICIDDGSTDNTPKILKRLAVQDKRLKIITNPSNIGLAASLNRALPLTRGQYIARMDADDISLPTRFAKQIALLESNPHLVAVGGQEEIIDHNGTVIAQKHFPTDPQACYQTLCNFMPIQPPLLMIRGSIFRTLRYNTKICKNDDINIYFQLLCHGSLGNVNDTIFQYRQLPNSLTHNNARQVFFMALRNRLDGIIRHGYRPRFSRLFLLLIQTILVAFLPSYLVVKLFEIIRYSKESFPFSLFPAKT